MAWDPLAPKCLAAAIALGGLSYMMVESAPHWGTIGVGLGSIVTFVILSLLPNARLRAADPAQHPAHPAHPPAPERRRRPVPDDEPPHRPLNSQPVTFKIMRERRRRGG